MFISPEHKSIGDRAIWSLARDDRGEGGVTVIQEEKGAVIHIAIQGSRLAAVSINPSRLTSRSVVVYHQIESNHEYDQGLFQDLALEYCRLPNLCRAKCSCRPFIFEFLPDLEPTTSSSTSTARGSTPGARGGVSEPQSIPG